MGNRFVVTVFLLQPVPHRDAVSQIAVAQVVGFGLRHGGNHRLLVLCKEREGSLPEGSEVFKRLLAQGVHPVILRGGLPNGDHHLIDFFHTGRVVKLRLDELHRVPIVKAKGIGVGLLLRHILKEFDSTVYSHIKHISNRLSCSSWINYLKLCYVSMILFIDLFNS